MTGVFLNPEVSAQSWYVVGRSDSLKAGQVRTFALLRRKITVYRGASGEVHALDAGCPHLGADLGIGEVVGDEIRCAFHHWHIGAEGTCRRAPGHATLPDRRARVYPTCERWGLIWLFNGDVPLFDLPPVPDEAAQDWTPVILPPRQIACHPHLVVGNGLDADHFQGLHGMCLSGEPRIEAPDPYTVSVHMEGRPREPWLQRLTRTRDSDLKATFSATGGSLAWASLWAPLRFHTLFTGKATDSGEGCHTQTLVFLPSRSPRHLFHAAVLLYTLLRADKHVLEHLDFNHQYTDRDEGLRLYAALLDRQPTG